MLLFKVLTKKDYFDMVLYRYKLGDCLLINKKLRRSGMKDEKEKIKKIIPPEQWDEEDEDTEDTGVLPIRALMKKVFKDEKVH